MENIVKLYFPVSRGYKQGYAKTDYNNVLLFKVTDFLFKKLKNEHFEENDVLDRYMFPVNVIAKKFPPVESRRQSHHPWSACSASGGDQWGARFNDYQIVKLFGHENFEQVYPNGFCCKKTGKTIADVLADNFIAYSEDGENWID